jgi:hypothetical protein
MSDLFLSYESDFELAYQEARTKLGQAAQLNDGM